jgi:hypothetical protein
MFSSAYPSDWHIENGDEDSCECTCSCAVHRGQLGFSTPSRLCSRSPRKSLILPTAKVGLKLENARAEAASIYLTIDACVPQDHVLRLTD